MTSLKWTPQRQQIAFTAKDGETLLRETMGRYESDFLTIYESNRRLIEFLRELNSPVPRPLQVAADVAVTREALQIARAMAGGKLELGAARAGLMTVAQTARRLGARIDLAALRLPFHAAMQAHFEHALRGRREDALAIAEVADIGVRLGMHLDLWDLQNALWDAMRAGTGALDREALAPLAAALWIDEAALASPAQPPAAVGAARGKARAASGVSERPLAGPPRGAASSDELPGPAGAALPPLPPRTHLA